MVPLSIDWQGRQRHMNHSSQAMVDLLGHRSEKNLYKTHYSMACHRIRRSGGGGGGGHILISVSLARCQLRPHVGSIFNPFRYKLGLIFTAGGGGHYRLHVSCPRSGGRVSGFVYQQQQQAIQSPRH